MVKTIVDSIIIENPEKSALPVDLLDLIPHGVEDEVDYSEDVVRVDLVDWFYVGFRFLGETQLVYFLLQVVVLVDVHADRGFYLYEVLENGARAV